MGVDVSIKAVKGRIKWFKIYFERLLLTKGIANINNLNANVFPKPYTGASDEK